MTATTLPSDLGSARTTFLSITGLTGGNIGALPDPDHKAGGGYHCGCQDIINIGKWATAGSSLADYSVRQERDRVGANACSAIDVGDDWPNGGRAAWIRFNNMLVSQMMARDPELAALRAVNFTPDGTARKRYDTLHRDQGVINSTDTVYMHTHLEWWRDTANTALRARSIARIAQIMRAAIANQPLNPITIKEEVQQMGQQLRVKANDSDDIWVVDGMFRRKELPGFNNDNNNSHAASLLGPLGNNGNVFNWGAPTSQMDYWGVDVSTFVDVPMVAQLDQEDVDAINAAMVAEIRALEADPATHAARVQDAFEGAQRAEGE